MELVSVNDLTKTYSKHAVVDHVSFDLQPGKCVALLGPNGAGKTTTLRMLAGFIQPTSGSISFNEDTFQKTSENLSVIFRSIQAFTRGCLVKSFYTMPVS